MHESVKLLERRCFASPDLVRGLAIETLQQVATVLRFADCIFTTGIGASEGPARLLASCLFGPHKHVRFIPLSGLIAADHTAWITESRTSVLVIFSQALSPNARIALEASFNFSTTILICGAEVSVDESIQSILGNRLHVIRHPPEEESGFLMRVMGPAAASAIALGLAALATTEQTVTEVRDELVACADAMEKRLHSRLPESNFVERPPAFLLYGADGVERNHLLRWTLLECLDQYDPPSWDVLSFAHGAFQNIFDASRTLILPRALDDVALLPLFDRLRDMLGQTRHTLVDIPSELRRPWCVLEHLAAVQALMLEHLRQNPRDLHEWPGRGRDGALYTLDKLPANS